MVGLYHKRKEQRSHSHSKLFYWLFKTFVFGSCFLVGAFIFVVFFFNGEQIKKPLSDYLSERTGLQVQIDNADFSVIYPDVIKLSNVKFGQSLVKDLYLEYDLSSILSDQEFVISDLYINGMTLDRHDLQKLRESTLGFKSLRANLLRLNHIPLKTNEIATKDATLRLNNVVYNKEDGLTFSKGSIQANDATFLNESSSSLAIDFQQSEEGIKFNHFSINMWGGVISGSGSYILAEHTNTRSLFDADLDEKSTPNTSALAFEDYPTNQYGSSNSTLTKHQGYLKLDELNLNKIILKNELVAPGNLEVHSKHTTLSQVIFAANSDLFTQDKKEDTELIDKIADIGDTPQESINKSKDAKPDQISIKAIVAQGIDGEIKDMILKDRQLTGKFEGKIDDFTLPGILTTITRNQGTIEFLPNQYNIDLSGSLYEGKYKLSAVVDSNKNNIDITNLELTGNKIGLHNQHLKFLQDKVDHYQITLEHAKFDKIEFLSYLNYFPVSVQEIQGNASALIFCASDQTIPSKTNTDKLNILTQEQKQAQEAKFAHKRYLQHKAKCKSNLSFLPFKILGKPNGTIHLQFKNALYTNLLMKSGTIDLTLTKQTATINIPKLDFKESSLSASASLSLDPNGGQSTLVAQAQDFETADLNSNLINHLLTGKVNFNLNLKSEHQGLDTLIPNLNGILKLNSKALLISDLGLDLINGGKKRNYKLTQNELLSAIQGSVAGINNLKLNTNFEQGIAKSIGSMELATANNQFNTIIDFNKSTIQGNGSFQSLARDSTSKVNISGTLSEPTYQIIALTRGELRPGLYLPQYESGAKAKQPTDTTLRRIHPFNKATKLEAVNKIEENTKVEKTDKNEKESAIKLKESSKVETKDKTATDIKAENKNTPADTTKESSLKEKATQPQQQEETAKEISQAETASKSEIPTESQQQETNKEVSQAETASKAEILTESQQQETNKEVSQAETASKAEILTESQQQEPDKEESQAETASKSETPTESQQQETDKEESQAETASKSETPTESQQQETDKEETQVKQFSKLEQKADSKQPESAKEEAEGKDVRQTPEKITPNANSKETKSVNQASEDSKEQTEYPSLVATATIEDNESTTDQIKADKEQKAKEEAEQLEEKLLKEAAIESFISPADSEEDMIF